MGSLENKSISTGFLEPHQLDALEWAKEFMNKYERKKNAVLAKAEPEVCRSYSQLENLPSPGEESLGEPPEKLSEKDITTTIKKF